MNRKLKQMPLWRNDKSNRHAGLDPASRWSAARKMAKAIVMPDLIWHLGDRLQEKYCVIVCWALFALPSIWIAGQAHNDETFVMMNMG